MSERDLSLAERPEDVREKIPVRVVSFSLDQIKEHFDTSVTSIESHFEIADMLLEQGREGACKDIWRSQIVYIESALDFFMHEITKYGTTQMFRGCWKKTPGYNKILIPLEDLEEGFKQPESGTWFISVMNRHFSFSTFMAYEKIASQLTLLGIKKEEVLKQAFSQKESCNGSHRKGDQVIQAIADRRNHIAHQCDCQDTNAEKNEIDKEYVQQAITDVKNLVGAIYEQVQIKDAES